MVVCSYCNHPIEPGTGKLFVRKDGKVFELCGSKCQKNWLQLGRKPLTLKWTETSRKFKRAQHAEQQKSTEKKQ